MKMKLINQLDIVSLLLWCILSFTFIKSINSIRCSIPCLDSIEGPVIYPKDRFFKPLIIDQNTRVNYTPSVLVYAINNEDVRKAVKCAVKSKKHIIARSGGHSYEKYGLGGRNGFIVLDVTFINDITIDPKKKTATIGAGNRMGNIYNKLYQAGFLTPAGSCPSVGIGGLALNGGYGFSSRKYGITCDNVVSMEMVDAKGELLQISSTSNSDLFFALRGAGGGSYGIVTNFVLNIYKIPSQVTVMKFEFNRKNMTQVYKLFDAYNKVGPSLVDDIALKMRLEKEKLSINGLYLGPRKKAEKAMKKFLSKAPKPIYKSYTQQTFLESVVTFSKLPDKYEVFNPKHHPNSFKVKSFLVNKGKGLNRRAIDTLVKFLDDICCGTFASIELFGGAINNRNYTSAFVHRDVLYCIQLETNSGQGTKGQGAKCVKEINNFGKRFQSQIKSDSSLQGYIDRDLDNWQKKYYGKFFGKLVKIKAEYDPNNLFQFPQSIPVKV